MDLDHLGKLGAVLLRRFLILANSLVGVALTLTLNPFALAASLVYFASAYWLTEQFDRRYAIRLPIEVRMIASLVLFIEIATR